MKVKIILKLTGSQITYKFITSYYDITTLVRIQIQDVLKTHKLK